MMSSMADYNNRDKDEWTLATLTKMMADSGQRDNADSGLLPTRWHSQLIAANETTQTADRGRQNEGDGRPQQT